jgi:hypothetical protein
MIKYNNMFQFPLGFTQCPKCKKYSINMDPFFSSEEERVKKHDNTHVMEWGCPYCHTILTEKEWRKKMVEYDEKFEKEQKNFLYGKIFRHSLDEITPQNAKEISIESFKNLNIKGPSADLESIRVSDCQEEWQVEMDKITKNTKNFLPPYRAVINKKTGQVNWIF